MTPSPAGRRLPDTYFDELYAASADPWGFTDRWYERRKRALTLAALPVRRYANAFEPGCSVGVLTAELATRCERLLATDVSAAALAAASQRLADAPAVTLRRWALGDPWPAEAPFDLIVLSEVLYYLGADLLAEVLPAARDELTPGGTLLAVHWRHDVGDYPTGGDEVHARLAELSGLVRLGGYRDDDVVIDVLQRVPPPARSVAAADGLS